MNKIIVTFLKETLIEMIVSAVLLAAVSFIVLRMTPSFAITKVMILAIYGISTFIGGYIIGKVMTKQKFIWGAVSGVVYFAIIALIALVVKGGIDTGTVGIISGFVVSVVAGTIGGMISVGCRIKSNKW